VAVQVRVIVIAQAVPFVTVLSSVMVTLPQLSEAVGGSKLQGRPHSTVLFDEQLIVGGVVSMTVTVWLHGVGLPQASVVIQMRVTVEPQLAPFVTVLVTVVVTLLQPSEAVGASKLQGWPHSTVLFCGQLMVQGQERVVLLMTSMKTNWTLSDTYRIAPRKSPSPGTKSLCALAAITIKARSVAFQFGVVASACASGVEIRSQMAACTESALPIL
jgi:hypothetical protein